MLTATTFAHSEHVLADAHAARLHRRELCNICFNELHELGSGVMITVELATM